MLELQLFSHNGSTIISRYPESRFVCVHGCFVESVSPSSLLFCVSRALRKVRSRTVFRCQQEFVAANADFHAYARMVTLEVVAKDRHGNHVNGLKATDFQVFEQSEDAQRETQPGDHQLS